MEKQYVHKNYRLLCWPNIALSYFAYRSYKLFYKKKAINVISVFSILRQINITKLDLELCHTYTRRYIN